MVVGSGVISAVAYAVPIIGVLVVISAKNLTNVGSFVAAYQTVVGNVLGGTGENILNFFVGAAIVFSLLTSGTVWLMGADRMMAIGALAGSGPKRLGYFSKRFGTPVPVNVLSGILASIFLLANVVVNHVYANGQLASLFGVVLSLAISTTTFSYIFVFPTLVILRHKFPNARRPYKIGGGWLGVYVVATLTWLYAVVSTVFSLWPGLFTNTVLGQASGVDRAPFEVTVLVTMGIIIAIGVIFWAIGRGHAVYDVLPGEGATVAAVETVGARQT
jgi:amino acid transporter